MADLGISTTLQLDFDSAVARTREALKEQGLGIVTEVDFKATIKEKIDESYDGSRGVMGRSGRQPRGGSR